MWHVSSRSGVATLQTAIHLLLTYLRLGARTQCCIVVLLGDESGELLAGKQQVIWRQLCGVVQHQQQSSSSSC